MTEGVRRERHGRPLTPRAAVLITLCVLVAGCSVIKVGYGQVDRLIHWYAERYVSLTPEQGESLRRRVVSLRAWHCGSQLPAYSGWLRRTHEEVRGPVSSARIGERFGQGVDLLRELARAASPHLSALLATLSREQVVELFASLEKRNEEYREEWVDITRRELENKRAEVATRRIESWIGPLLPVQERAVASWSRSLATAGADLLENRRRWQAALRSALEHRGSGERFVAEIGRLLGEPEQTWSAEFALKVRANREASFVMLAEVAAAMDESQRRHLAREVAKTAGELQDLACAPGGAPRASGPAWLASAIAGVD